MNITLISGDGTGAGKTTLARRLSPHIYSLATGIRDELAELYPGYPWHDRTQTSKIQPIPELGDVNGNVPTLRDVMIQYGQARCQEDTYYWARRLSTQIQGKRVAVVDDIRKVIEVEHLRGIYGSGVVHLHVTWGGAVHEPQYDNEQLADMADYIVNRRR